MCAPKGQRVPSASAPYVKSVLRFGSCTMVGSGLLGGKLERCTVSPASDEFGGQLLFATAVERCLLFEIVSEGGDILVQFAIDHEGPIAGQKVRYRRHRQFAGFVRISQQQLTRCEGRPCSVGQQLALSGLGAALDADVIGIAEAVGVAEVFAGRKACHL